MESLVKLLGYSERGVLNTFFFELARKPERLGAFMKAADLDLFSGDSAAVSPTATVLLEPSLSGFGTADAILLIDHGDTKSAVFIEAKVKTAKIREWQLEAEWQRFMKAFEPGEPLPSAHASNLFAQLYHKDRFAAALAREDGLQVLNGGLKFGYGAGPRNRKIGKHPVVLRAVASISPYVTAVRFLAIVPDQSGRSFFRSLTSKPCVLKDWRPGLWRGLCWRDLHDWCKHEGFCSSQSTLDFNKEQIY